MNEKEIFHVIYNAAHNNAIDLLKESKILFEAKHYPRSYFLALTALEELSKSQMAADVYTSYIKADKFYKHYSKHNKKLNRIEWAHSDAIEFAYYLRDKYGEQIEIKKPSIKKRMQSLYVDIGENESLQTPNNTINKQDAEEMIHIVMVALQQIITRTEYYGHQIGTKGFMK
ncbi:hypothetical protein C0416_01375 [bacterium]|nr:hypothetical protein [bacterium]